MSVFVGIEGNYFKARTNVEPIFYVDRLLSGVSISLIDSIDNAFNFYYDNQPIQYLQNVNINDIVAENGTDFNDLASFIIWKDRYTGSIESVDVNDYIIRVEDNENDIELLQDSQLLQDEKISDLENLSSWEYLATNWSVQPSVNTSLANGVVYDYTLNEVNRFRFVPNPYNSNQDSFYSNFDGTTLTGLITTRG